MNTLAILWEKNSNRLSYLVYEPASLSVLLVPTQLTIINTHSMTKVLNQMFNLAIKNAVTEIEYKILQHGTPATNFSRQPTQQPHSLSAAIYNSVLSSAARLQITLNPQIRSKLTGNSLNKFRAGLRDLQLVNSGSGTAWEAHLWSVALHATDANVENVVKKIWSSLKQVSVRSQVGKTQFSAWYANL